MAVKPTITRCPTCGRKRRRSTGANARYWLLVSMIASEIKPQGAIYSSETFHEYFKQRYLGADEIKLPNGKTIIRPHSTADLSTDEFNAYMEKVELWASEHGVWLEMETA